MSSLKMTFSLASLVLLLGSLVLATTHRRWRTWKIEVNVRLLAG